MALQKVYDASGEVYYVDVTKLAPDGQGRIGNRQRFDIGNGSVVGSATILTVVAGAASGALLAANENRIVGSFYNTHGSDTAYINIGADATSADIPIRAGEWLHLTSFGVIFTEVINCIRGGSEDITLVVVSG